ncbi:MAG TPA: hypothetical protein VF941_06730 [Clostridia bacterium]
MIDKAVVKEENLPETNMQKGNREDPHYQELKDILQTLEKSMGKIADKLVDKSENNVDSQKINFKKSNEENFFSDMQNVMMQTLDKDKVMQMDKPSERPEEKNEISPKVSLKESKEENLHYEDIKGMLQALEKVMDKMSQDVNSKLDDIQKIVSQIQDAAMVRYDKEQVDKNTRKKINPLKKIINIIMGQ